MRLSVSRFALWLIAIPAAIVAIYTIVPALFPYLPPEPEGHALSHGLPAVAMAVVTVGMVRTRAARRRGERLALGALLALALAQLAEGASAFAEDPARGAIHDAASLVSAVLVLALGGGIVWSLADAVRSRAISPWYALAVIAILAALMVRMAIGF